MASRGGKTPSPRRRPDDPDTDATRATRAQVESESNTSPRTRSDLDAPRSATPETRAVPEEAPPAQTAPTSTARPAQRSRGGRPSRRRRASPSGEIASQLTSLEGDVPIPIQLNPGNTTPVYGTAQPASGPFGALRRQAYGYPAHDARRWLLLLAADRVESGGNLACEAVTPGQQGEALRHVTRQVRSYPKGVAALGLGLLGFVAWRGLRP